MDAIEINRVSPERVTVSLGCGLSQLWLHLAIEKPLAEAVRSLSCQQTHRLAWLPIPACITPMPPEHYLTAVVEGSPYLIKTSTQTGFHRSSIDMPFEPNALYILLTWQDSSTSWHWMIYMSDAPDGDGGFAIHVNNRSGPYIIERKDPYDGATSQSSFIMVKVGHVHNQEMSRSVKALLLKKLGQAVDGPTFMQGQSRERRQRDRVFTCRVFVMNLIEKLASAGYIQCTQFLELEDEVKALAVEASSGFRRGMVPKYYNSAYSRAITH
jgi:hypothetical protein